MDGLRHKATLGGFPSGYGDKESGPVSWIDATDRPGSEAVATACRVCFMLLLRR